MPMPKHEPTPETRKLVQLHTTVGTTQDNVARIIGIDAKTLRKHYRDELDLSLAKANATIGGALFNKAKAGDTAAMIFWMKTQAGWKEKSVVEGPGPNGEHLVTTLDPTRMSSEALREFLSAVRPDATSEDHEV